MWVRRARRKEELRFCASSLSTAGPSRSICLQQPATGSRPASPPGRMSPKARSWMPSQCHPGTSRSASADECIGRQRSYSRLEGWRRQSFGGQSQTACGPLSWCQRLTKQGIGGRSEDEQLLSCNYQIRPLTLRMRRRRWGITRCSWWISRVLTRQRRRVGRSVNNEDAESAWHQSNWRSALESRLNCPGWRRGRPGRQAPHQQISLAGCRLGRGKQ